MSAPHKAVASPPPTTTDSVSAEKRAEACIDIAKFWLERSDGRRQYEWKVTLGLWAVILSAIAYHEKLSFIPLNVWFLIAIACLASYVRGWLFPLWIRNKIDREQGFHALRQGQQILQKPEHIPDFLDHKLLEQRSGFEQFSQDWAMRFEAGATALLLIVLIVVVWSKTH